MTGAELKKKIRGTEKTQKEIAILLGTSPQALISIFNSIDVKSGTLEKIAAALGKDMSFFYPMRNNAIASGTGSVAAIQSTITQGDAQILAERVKHLEELVAEKERLISILMETRK